MTYQEAEQFIFSLSSLETDGKKRQRTERKNKIQEMQDLLDFFGNPEKQISHYIHVTGTSGKGSVCFFLFSLLQKKYKKVGMCVSPHPSFLLERWHYAGKHMTPSEFIDIVRDLQKGLKKYLMTKKKAPSFFMITTLIGLLYFVKKGATWAIFEVGIGGTTDSTNVIPYKDYAVITNIGYDHMNLLGETKEEIAAHKAGIIKPDCEVFTMEKNKKILHIFQNECNKQKASLRIVNNIATVLDYSLSGSTFIYKDEIYQLSVLGKHQIHNALLCIEIGFSLGMKPHEIAKALKQTKQPLRLEIVTHSPLLILDGAHNSEKIKTTVEALLELKRKKLIEDIHLTLGMTQDREKIRMQKIQYLAKLKPKTLSCSQNTMNPFVKSIPGEVLKKRFESLLPKTKIEIFSSPEKAFTWSQKQQKTKDCLLSTGSIFYSGEIRKKFLLN